MHVPFAISVQNPKQQGKSQFLSNGPSKLCIAMDINKTNCNKLDLGELQNDMLWIEDDPEFEGEEMRVVETSRIGIERVDPEWAKKPLRFYILGNASVSKRDRLVESSLTKDDVWLKQPLRIFLFLFEMNVAESHQRNGNLQPIYKHKQPKLQTEVYNFLENTCPKSEWKENDVL